jgi:hypothetical protein
VAAPKYCTCVLRFCGTRMLVSRTVVVLYLAIAGVVKALTGNLLYCMWYPNHSSILA